MREFLELRVEEEFAPLVFTDSEGERLGDSIRKIVLDSSDPRCRVIEATQARLKSEGSGPLFLGYIFHRKYRPAELQAAALFQLSNKIFEPCGEEHGTIYDETVACPCCGAGSVQVGPLRLPPSRVPKGCDFATTIAGEHVISKRMAEILSRAGVTGAHFTPIRHGRPPGIDAKDWFQLRISGPRAKIVPPTQLGAGPFDRNQIGKCQLQGDTAGLNVLSEVSIQATTRGEADFLETDQYVGVRRGALRPERQILISPKVQRIIMSEGKKGCKIEIAHLTTV